MDETSGLVGWILAGFTSVAATLASAVAILWRKQSSDQDQVIAKLEVRMEKQEKRSDECEDDRLRLSRELATVTGELLSLRSKVCEIENTKANRESIDKLRNELS